MNQIEELTKKCQKVVEKYKITYPDVKMDRDYLPFKITEEWGELMQTYLMLTDRGRQKGKTKEEIVNMMEMEFADMFAYLLVFAKNENIDLVQALNNKWFKYLE
ncbi:MAG: phosphoribosyl-ATP pyrophosphohydrolase [Candidatus Paceibacterota bacterium]|jgi:NTP pyrophosphatase (non-canonical NTP hydrolase)